MKCICVKNGYMLSGSQFCAVGEIYNYKIANSRKRYIVDSMASNGHSMQNDFFHEYYIKHNVPFMMKNVDDLDFEI